MGSLSSIELLFKENMSISPKKFKPTQVFLSSCKLGHYQFSKERIVYLENKEQSKLL